MVFALGEKVAWGFGEFEDEDADERECECEPAEGYEGVSPAAVLEDLATDTEGGLPAHVLSSGTGVWSGICRAGEVCEEDPCQQGHHQLAEHPPGA